jgi:hypothetical protein
MEYLHRVPASVPDDGRVLVHNEAKPSHRMSSSDFRAWLQTKDDTLEPCRCGFASKLGVHYRKRFRA